MAAILFYAKEEVLNIGEPMIQEENEIGKLSSPIKDLQSKIAEIQKDVK